MSSFHVVGDSLDEDSADSKIVAAQFWPTPDTSIWPTYHPSLGPDPAHQNRMIHGPDLDHLWFIPVALGWHLAAVRPARGLRSGRPERTARVPSLYVSVCAPNGGWGTILLSGKEFSLVSAVCTNRLCLITILLWSATKTNHLVPDPR